MFSISSNIEDFPKQLSKRRLKVLVNSGGGLFGYVITNFMSYLDEDIRGKIDVLARHFNWPAFLLWCMLLMTIIDG